MNEIHPDILKLRSYRKTAQVKVDSYRKHAMENMEEFHKNALMLKEAGEIEDVQFPGGNPEAPELQMVCKDDTGKILIRYMVTSQDQQISVTAGPLTFAAMAALDIEPRRYFDPSDAYDLYDYVLRCIAAIQAGNHKIDRLEERLKHAVDNYSLAGLAVLDCQDKTLTDIQLMSIASSLIAIAEFMADNRKKEISETHTP